MHSSLDILYAAYQGSLLADALAMPVHWYYSAENLDNDFPDLSDFYDPKRVHPDSILWRSSYVAINENAEILHDQAKYWGQRNIHYHQNLRAGENTVNYQLAAALYQQVKTNENYSPSRWLETYIRNMLTPGWHRDTYLEEYHWGFFTRYAQGKKPEKCGIKDEHIGGLAQVPALIAALSSLPIEELRTAVKSHVVLTHRHSNVLRAADCLTRLLHIITEGRPLREAIMQGAGDWFSTNKAIRWEKRADREIIGQHYSPACYIDQAFPAALYLAWKYHDDFQQGIVANAKVGGDNCHRAAVVGSLIAAANPRQYQTVLEKREIALATT